MVPFHKEERELPKFVEGHKEPRYVTVTTYPYLKRSFAQTFVPSFPPHHNRPPSNFLSTCLTIPLTLKVIPTLEVVPIARYVTFPYRFSTLLISSTAHRETTTAAVKAPMVGAGTTTPIRMCNPPILVESDLTVTIVPPSNGSYYYQNPNGSTYYNSGSGQSTYTSPSGYTKTSGK